MEYLNLNEIDTSQHVWIPHRPIIKIDSQTTTKIRPVLNCSFRAKNFPSLNDASYGGVDLLTGLLTNLLRIRSDSFFLMADIRKAFLQIKLANVEDKNRFSILWLNEEGKLISFRYNTLVFGLTASPFILNFLIKHHVKRYAWDTCSKILYNNFYVDNLFMTGNSIPHLMEIYKLSCSRMEEGGFHLYSWVSNTEKMKAQFLEDARAPIHSEIYEKLLGYLYSPTYDHLTISCSNLQLDIPITKRRIVSSLAKWFDPLGLVSPVLVRGKILIRMLWSNKKDWDEPLEENYVTEWRSIESSLCKLNLLHFPRKVFNTEVSNDLNIFCDASSQAYGFVVYGLHSTENKLLLSEP